MNNHYELIVFLWSAVVKKIILIWLLVSGERGTQGYPFKPRIKVGDEAWSEAFGVAGHQ